MKHPRTCPLRRAARWLDFRLGYRGSLLLTLGLVDWLVALSIYVPPDPITPTSQFRYLKQLAPLPFWGTVWACVGSICLVYAWRRDDWPAFVAASFLKLMWITVLLYGWLFAGVTRGWASASTWLIAAIMVMRLASWPEPRRDAHGRVSE